MQLKCTVPLKSSKRLNKSEKRNAWNRSAKDSIRRSLVSGIFVPGCLESLVSKVCEGTHVVPRVAVLHHTLEARRRFLRFLELRKTVRSDLYHKPIEIHEHKFGDEQYDEKEDKYFRECTVCSHKDVYEKL